MKLFNELDESDIGAIIEYINNGSGGVTWSKSQIGVIGFHHDRLTIMTIYEGRIHTYDFPTDKFEIINYYCSQFI